MVYITDLPETGQSSSRYVATLGIFDVYVVNMVIWDPTVPTWFLHVVCGL